jgi:hypothetical protein
VPTLVIHGTADLIGWIIPGVLVLAVIGSVAGDENGGGGRDRDEPAQLEPEPEPEANESEPEELRLKSQPRSTSRCRRARFANSATG